MRGGQSTMVLCGRWIVGAVVGSDRKRNGGGGSKLAEQGCSTLTPLRNAAGLFNSLQNVPFGVGVNDEGVVRARWCCMVVGLVVGLVGGLECGLSLV